MDEIDLLKGFRDDMPEPTTDAWLRARAAIAAAGGEPRSGKSRARRNARGGATTRVRWFRPLYAATLTAVAAVAATTGALLSQSPAPTGSTTVDVVRTMVAGAMHSYSGDIVRTQSTITLASGTVYTRDWWDYPLTSQPGSTVQQVGSESESGSPINSWSLSFTVPQNESLTAANDCQLTPQGTTIDYSNHTWQSSPPPCVTVPTPGLDMFSPTARIIGYAVIVDGQKTIEFQSASSTETFTFWISTANDLPLQSLTTEKDWTDQERYTYLPPTSANMAKLTLNPPINYQKTAAQTLVQHAGS
jgi:hypothetical protein